MQGAEFKDVSSLQMWRVPLCVFGFLLCKIKITITSFYLTEGTVTLAMLYQENRRWLFNWLQIILSERVFHLLDGTMINMTNPQDRGKNNRWLKDCDLVIMYKEWLWGKRRISAKVNIQFLVNRNPIFSRILFIYDSRHLKDISSYLVELEYKYAFLFFY